jgi:hypothetical protein
MKNANELFKAIADRVRVRAAEYADFAADSVVRIAIVPLCNGAEWVLGLSGTGCCFEKVEYLNQELLMQSSKEVFGEFSCLGYSALKLVNCMRNVSLDRGVTSRTGKGNAEKFLVPANGYADDLGCVSYLIGYRSETEDSSTPWARVYVCVSGGTGEQDDCCAKTAKQALREAFSDFQYVICDKATS